MSGYDPKTCDHDGGNTEFERGILQCNLCEAVLQDKPLQTRTDKNKEQHYFVPDNLGEDEPPSSFCKECGKYLTDENHKRELH